MNNAMTSGRSQRGVTLVEVLVTLLLLVTATAATASLLLSSKRSAIDAIQRSVASQLIADLAERMRNNPTARDLYYSPTGGFGGSQLPASSCTVVNHCSAATLAQSDIAVWESMLDGSTERKTIDGEERDVGGLVNGRGCVSGPSGGGVGLYTIAIAWRGGSKMENSTASDCGNSSGLYGTNNEYRRVIVVTVFMS